MGSHCNREDTAPFISGWAVLISFELCILNTSNIIPKGVKTDLDTGEKS